MQINICKIIRGKNLGLCKQHLGCKVNEFACTFKNNDSWEHQICVNRDVLIDMVNWSQIMFKVEQSYFHPFRNFSKLLSCIFLFYGFKNVLDLILLKREYIWYIISVQSLSCVQLFATPWTAACQASLSITSSWSLLRVMSIESVMPYNHLILCCPLLLPPSVFPSIRVFSNEWVLRIRWPKYCSFSLSINPSNEHPGLISFRMDWQDLLAVQGTLKSLLQHHSSKASIFPPSVFFIVQLSHPYTTNGKTIALTRWTFGKVMSLLHSSS